MKKIPVKTSQGEYEIILERGSLRRASQFYTPCGRALVVTDSGVPAEYSKAVSAEFPDSLVFTFNCGEENKSFETLKELLMFASKNGYTRNSTFIAVGGGVVGDLTGLASSLYMRGVDFVNIPTTLLSQVDSSVGGKTAVDLDGVKNLVGTFYQPKIVIIDPDTLHTLPERQFSNGLAESIKMAATSDEKLFSSLEQNDAHEIIETVIERSLLIKKSVVEKDEKESGLRRVLNFGHTFAHAYEALGGFSKYYHGECVGAGMMLLSFFEARDRIKKLLIKNKLPVKIEATPEEVESYFKLDKKAESSGVNVVTVKKIGSFEFEFLTFKELSDMLR